jgi:hypothetical protein
MLHGDGLFTRCGYESDGRGNEGLRHISSCIWSVDLLLLVVLLFLPANMLSTVARRTVSSASATSLTKRSISVQVSRDVALLFID